MPTQREAIDRVRVGARIRKLRTERGILGKQLAEAIGCSDTHVYNIEAGRSRATAAARAAIAQLLGVQLEDIEVK